MAGEAYFVGSWSGNFSSGISVNETNHTASNYLALSVVLT